MNPRPLITIMPHLPSIRTSGQAIRLLPTPHPSLALVRVLIYVMLQDPRGYHHHVNPSIWAHCHRPENYPTSGFPPKTLFPNTHTCTHAQSCLTLCNPMDCSPSGSSVLGILGKNSGVGCYFPLQGIFLTQGSNPCLLHLLHWQVDSLPLHHLGSPCSLQTTPYINCLRLESPK